MNKRLFRLGIMVSLLLGACFSTSGLSEVSAYYADNSSAVYQGSDQRGYRYSAVNVVDDDGTVYTVYYRFRPRTDDIAYRFEGDPSWSYWQQGLRVVYTHMEELATAGRHAAIRIAQ